MQCARSRTRRVSRSSGWRHDKLTRAVSPLSGTSCHRIRQECAMTTTHVGTVSDLRRYPVKSMLGEQLGRAALTDKGIPGDRAYALVDEETGKVVSVKRPKRWGRMFELTASTSADSVRVSFPD